MFGDAKAMMQPLTQLNLRLRRLLRFLLCGRRGVPVGFRHSRPKLANHQKRTRQGRAAKNRDTLLCYLITRTPRLCGCRLQIWPASNAVLANKGARVVSLVTQKMQESKDSRGSGETTNDVKNNQKLPCA